MRLPTPLLLIASVSFLLSAVLGCEKGLSIDGTYRLVEREYPDGSRLRPPDVVGLMTFTEDYRNLNIYWNDGAGNPASVSYLAHYTFTDTLYREESLYHMVNDEIAGHPIYYDVPGPSGSSPVFVDGEQIEIQLPLYDEPKLIFEGDSMTAIKDGVFIDHWEKVETETE